MRVVFIGTSPFACPVLSALHAAPEHEVLAVVTQPDRPHGRGGQDSLTPVKKAAIALGLPVLQPERVKAKDFIETIRQLLPDVLVVAAFGQIIPQRLLDIPPFGGINVHGSLLPRWRGAAPMQYALIHGDTETGVTTMQMDAGLDTGDMLLQSVLPLTDEDNLGTLETKLSLLGAPLLLETLKRLAEGNCPRVSQDAALVTLAPSLPPDAGALDWKRSAQELHHLVRGVTPRPGAYAVWQGRRIKVWKTAPVLLNGGSPGAVQTLAADGITVMTGAGGLQLIEVQPESKARMKAADWARGVRISAGQSFDASASVTHAETKP